MKRTMSNVKIRLLLAFLCYCFFLVLQGATGTVVFGQKRQIMHGNGLLGLDSRSCRSSASSIDKACWKEQYTISAAAAAPSLRQGHDDSRQRRNDSCSSTTTPCSSTSSFLLQRSLEIRGGSVGGIFVTLFKTAIRNPVYILCTWICVTVLYHVPVPYLYTLCDEESFLWCLQNQCLIVSPLFLLLALYYILVMAASILLEIYKENVPNAKLLSNFVGLCIAAYTFYLLTEWQKMQKDAEEEES